MTKADVVNQISERTGLEKVDVQEVMENFFKVVRGALMKGENVYFRGFGSFIIKKRAQKVARNITKNTSIVIPPHYVPAFKPSKQFTEKVKKNLKV